MTLTRKRLGAALVSAIAIVASAVCVACVDGATADCSDASTYCGPDAAIDSGDAGDAGDAVSDGASDALTDADADAAADADASGQNDASDGAADAPSIDAKTD